MTQTEIRRIAPAEEELPSVRQEAEEVLGYTRPKPEETTQDLLQRALAELDITILDWRDVMTYQLEKRQEAEREQLKQAVIQEERPHWWSSVGWRQTELEKYKGWVPDHVLLKAIQIKRRLPEVEFAVEALEQSRDPFLVAKIRKGSYDWQEYYVEVWNEPEFERRI